MNFITLTFSFFLISSVWHASRGSTVVSQGNILYVKSDRAATINPILINFHRAFDFSYIEQSIKTLDEFLNTYGLFCKMADTYYSEPPEIVPIKIISYMEAQSKCNQYNSKLPEISNHEEAAFLLQQLQKHQINRTFTGLTLFNNKLVYLSDMAPATFTTARMCENCTLQNTLTEDDLAQIRAEQGNDVHLYYVAPPRGGHLAIIPFGHDPEIPCPRVPMICFKQRNVIPTTLNVLAKHSCLRDQTELARISTNLKEEVRQFYTPPTKRPKRAIGLIGAGIGAGFLGVEALNSLISGVAPLSLMGKGIASIFGFATSDDMRLTKEQLEAHSKGLKDLAVNQQMLIEGYRQVKNDIDLMKKANLRQEHDVAVLFANLDNKLAIRNLQMLLQITLLKMSQAVASAAQHYTSPYVFGVEDLKNLTATFRYQGVPLTADLNDVYTTLAVVDNMYTFIFSAPILTQENDMFLYEIRDLPFYNGKTQYRLNITYRYIAINFNTDEYVLLSDAEYFNCLKSHLCTAASSFLGIGKDSPCEVLSLKYNAQHCELHIYSEPMPNFLTFGNVTYYSLPSQTEVQIICKDTQASTTQYKQLYGTGALHTAPGCQLKIDKTASIRPSYVVSRHNLEGDTFFKFLKVPDRPLNFPTTQKPDNTSTSPYAFKDVSSVGDAVSIVFNHDATVAELIRIIFYIVMVLSVLGMIYCCFPRFRLWFNGCCFCEKPTKYWRDVKGYKVPDYISKNRQKREETQMSTMSKFDIDAVDENIETLTALESEPESIKSTHTIIRRPEAPPPSPPMTPIPPKMPPLPNLPNLTSFRPQPFAKIQRLYDPLFIPSFKN